MKLREEVGGEVGRWGGGEDASLPDHHQIAPHVTQLLRVSGCGW